MGVGYFGYGVGIVVVFPDFRLYVGCCNIASCIGLSDPVCLVCCGTVWLWLLPFRFDLGVGVGFGGLVRCLLCSLGLVCLGWWLWWFDLVDLPGVCGFLRGWYNIVLACWVWFWWAF